MDDEKFKQHAVLATILAALLHFAWFVFYGWYHKVTDSILCSDPNEPGGFIEFFPDCPEPRPYTDVVTYLVPVLGIGLTPLLTLLIFRISIRRVHPITHFYLGCVVSALTLAAIWILIVFLVLIAMAQGET